MGADPAGVGRRFRARRPGRRARERRDAHLRGARRRAGRQMQLRAAALTALFALGFDLLFFAVSELPATGPVALALLALSGELGLRGERRDTARQGAALAGGRRGYTLSCLVGPAPT